MAEVQKTTQSGEMSQRFIEFVIMHAQNAALFLGQIPNPKTGEPEVNLDLARMFIDQLEMIQEKTLSNLQMAFVEVSREAPQGAAQRETAAPASPPEPEQPSAAAPEPSPPIASTESEAESRKKFTKSYGP
jgi:Domain of unknown function (DUF1844)